MNKIKCIKFVVASICISLSLMVNANAAAYVKYDGIDGESKDDAHDKWIDVLSVDVRKERLIVTLKNGEKKRLTETGTYRFDDGRVFIISNGRVIEQNRTAPRIQTKPERKSDMIMKGKKILEN